MYAYVRAIGNKALTAANFFPTQGGRIEQETPAFFRLQPPVHPKSLLKSLILNGGQGRNRTADAGLFRAALYQLSYLAVGLRNWQYRKQALLCQIAGKIRTSGQLLSSLGRPANQSNTVARLAAKIR
jgi:hypothetical protein